MRIARGAVSTADIGAASRACGRFSRRFTDGEAFGLKARRETARGEPPGCIDSQRRNGSARCRSSAQRLDSRPLIDSRRCHNTCKGPLLEGFGSSLEKRKRFSRREVERVEERGGALSETASDRISPRTAPNLEDTRRARGRRTGGHRLPPPPAPPFRGFSRSPGALRCRSS